jgi:hypothetical protein
LISLDIDDFPEKVGIDALNIRSVKNKF